MILNINQITGTIPTTLPSSLRTLWASHNLLTGGIPSVLPIGLQSLSLEDNQLVGSIPSILPNTLTLLYLHNNRLSGDLPQFPNSIQSLILDGNKLSGTLSLFKPSSVYVINNLITEVIIQDTSTLGSDCDLSDNPLLGSFNIAALTMCKKNRLFTMTTLRSSTNGVKQGSSTLMENTTAVPQMVTTDYLTISTTTTSTFNDMTSVGMALASTINTAKMTSATMTSTTPLTTSSERNLATVQLNQIVVVFAIHLMIVARVLVNGMVLTGVVLKTPFGREFKKLMQKANKKEISNNPEV